MDLDTLKKTLDDLYSEIADNRKEIADLRSNNRFLTHKVTVLQRKLNGERLDAAYEADLR